MKMSVNFAYAGREFCCKHDNHKLGVDIQVFERIGGELILFDCEKELNKTKRDAFKKKLFANAILPYKVLKKEKELCLYV